MVDFHNRKSNCLQKVYGIYEELTVKSKIFEVNLCDPEIKNMIDALHSISSLVQTEVCEKAVGIFKKEVNKGNEFKLLMRKFVDSKVKKAKIEIESIAKEFAAAIAKKESNTNRDEAALKYKLAYEYITRIINLAGQFELDMKKVKDDVAKCEKRQKSQVEFIKMIDITLIENIIPEVRRRRAFEKLEGEFKVAYNKWTDYENSLRRTFVELFRFKEIPDIFSTLLLPGNQLSDEDAIISSKEYQEDKVDWNEFIQRQKKYYEEWREDYKRISTTQSLSTLRRENKDLQEKYSHLLTNYNHETEMNSNRTKEIENLKTQVQQSIKQALTTDSNLTGEKATTDQLRMAISDLQQKVAGLESMVTILKSEKSTIQADLSAKESTFKTQKAEIDMRMQEMETSMKAFTDTIYDKGIEIAKKDDLLQEANHRFSELAEHAKRAIQEKEEVAKQLSVFKDLNGQFNKEIVSLKQKLESRPS